MMSLLQLLRQHWKRILFRAHKDRRSLSALLVLLGIAGYCAFEGYLLFRQPLSFVMLALGLFMAWRMRKSHAREDESLIRLSSYEPVSITPSEVASAALRSETMKLGLLVWRASSEQFLRAKTLPEGAEVITRRTVLDKLDSLGLRGDLSVQELELHLAPDGGWSKESVLQNLIRAAELEALQYCSGAINTLSPIEDFDRIPLVNLDCIRADTRDTEWKTRETFDIRRERDNAAAFYLRCLAEQVRRGIAQGAFDEEQNRILQEASAGAENQGSDRLIGIEIISDVEEEKLNIAAVQSRLRFLTLEHALSVLEAV
ncbi:MAG: hypothetical protein KGK08_02455 [Acidobacteriota bacterium]|nr:hypothetical protein [Acidobacteriota bacterium]